MEKQLENQLLNQAFQKFKIFRMPHWLIDKYIKTINQKIEDYLNFLRVLRQNNTKVNIKKSFYIDRCSWSDAILKFHWFLGKLMQIFMY